MKTTTFRNDILLLIFNATAIANIADNAASSPATNLYLALHTAWPGLTGNQGSSEATYTGYARPAVARSGSGWTVSTNTAALAATASFGACTASAPGSPATHFSVGTASSGTGKILRMGVIGSRMGPFSAKADDTITIPGHTLAVNDRVVFHAVDGSSLPTGMTEGTSYWVITASGDDITVSTTQGGSALNLTSVGDGIAYKSTPITITASPSVTPQLGTGTTIYEE